MRLRKHVLVLVVSLLTAFSLAACDSTQLSSVSTRAKDGTHKVKDSKAVQSFKITTSKSSANEVILAMAKPKISSTAGATLPSCKATQIQVSIGGTAAPGFGMQDYISTFIFTNASTTTCSLWGHSNFVFEQNGTNIDGRVFYGDGSVLGFASRDAEPGDPDTLPSSPLTPGSSVVELVQTTAAGSECSDSPITVRITLPHSSGVITLYGLNKVGVDNIHICPREGIIIGAFQINQKGYPPPAGKDGVSASAAASMKIFVPVQRASD